MSKRLVVAIVGFVLSAGGVARAEELAVHVTVSEPAGVARVAEPASGGVPFLKGQVKDVSELTLVDGSGKAVPAQFSKLAGYEDGSVQWALVDLLTDVPANGKAEFTVGKWVSAGSPARALKIAETDDAVTIDTGLVELAVSKRKFSLFESVKLNGQAVAGNAGQAGLAVVDSEGAQYFAGPPAKVSWEYRGPIRATLRVDGVYQTADGKWWMGYTVRITAWAGSGLVRVEHSLRNSARDNGFDARIRQATVAVKLDGLAGEQGSGPDWSSAGLGKAGVLLVQRHSGGCFPGGSSYAPSRSQTLYKQSLADGLATVWVVPPGDTPPSAKTGSFAGYAKDRSFFALADLAHKDTEIFFDFYSGPRDASANKARRNALRCPLHVLPDGEWISRTEALGSGRFGTLADEIATYKLWGWKGWDDPKKQPHLAHVDDAYVASESIHGESEADNAEAFLMMYVRTGARGYLDWGRAWAEFGKTHYAYRTDGFAYQGKTRKTSGLAVGWYGPKEYGWSDSRSEYCHFYGRGIFDYYCLTGDVDALEGGRDLVEQVAEWTAKYKPGQGIGYYGCRGFARDWLAALRLAQLTRSPEDRKLADRLAEVVFKASDWDPRGFVFWGAGPGYMASHQFAAAAIPPKVKAYMAEHSITIDKNGMVTDKAGATWPLRSDGGTWQQVTLGMALERYYRLTGSEQAKALAVRMAEFARKYQISHKCQYAFYYTILDFPERDRVFDMADWDEAHAVCPTGAGPAHDGHYTRFFPDVFARAYSLTGDKSWLDDAKAAWNRGSKRGYRATKVSAGDDEVYVFASNEAPKSDTVLSTVRMFYEIPRAK